MQCANSYTFSRSNSPYGQRGLSLIELLIALVISVVMVAALSELYVNTSRTNQEMAKTNTQIENARFAMQFLQNDIVHAGYWGSFVPEFTDLTLIDPPNDTPTLVPDPCLPFATPWAEADIDAMIGIPVQVHDTVAGTCGGLGIIANRLPGTDILVVRHANTCVPGEANCQADIEPNLYFQPSNCVLEIEDDIFYTLDTVAANFTRYERDCVGSSGSPPTITAGTTAAKRKFIQNIYYIRDYANTVGDGIPTLVRSRFDLNASGTLAGQQPAEELVQGIEAFRVELGIDNLSDTGAAVDYSQGVAWADEDVLDSPTNRGDGIPDGNFVHCGAGCTAAQLTDAVAVKIWILARADEPTAGYSTTKVYRGGSNNSVSVGPFTDSFKRHVFSTTVRINNNAGRRETP